MPTEFEFIRNIKKTYGLNRVGDDCAVLPKDSRTDLVVTADLLVEDIDFRLESTTPELLGHKVLAVSLSDIAAMGATPKWSTLSIGVPEKLWDSKFLDKFYAGWFALADRHGVELVGGDVSRTPDRAVFDSVAGGEVQKGRAVMRTGTKPGDAIFVSGSLGGAAGGLSLLETGSRFRTARGRKRDLILRQVAPTPRVELGKHLQTERLATSMIDISDGLSADLHHLCDASGVGAEIALDQIPVDENLEGMSASEMLAHALGGGEDFELLFTTRRKKIFDNRSTRVTRIGSVTENTGIVEVVRDNVRQILPRLGYKHF